MIEALLEFIQINATILTPNRRLAATLHKLYQKHQITTQQAWKTPDILPITSWIQRIFENHTSENFASHPILLNTTQENFLWEQILTNAQESPLFLQISKTADLAKSAWDLLKQWLVDINDSAFHSADDYAALQRWINAFQTLCQQHNWIDRASLPDLLIEKITNNAIKPPDNLVLVGFNEISPQLTKLLQTCAKAGTHVNKTTLSQKQTNHHLISLPDLEAELLTMARWAQSTHEKNPDATIACVIPTLDKIRDRAIQIFSEVFAANNTYTVDRQACPFNISAGRPLSQFPIINAAIQLLSLHKKTTSSDTLSYILTSPFLGEAESERIKRANFDMNLRKDNVNRIDLTKATTLSNTCPSLNKRIQAFFETLSQQNKTHSYYEWAHIFHGLLAKLGWPGERSLSSEEYQTIDAWLTLLTDFQSLDQVAESCDFYHALQVLKKIASKTIFQPQTPDAKIQVLGLLEAAALPFDYLWVAGLDDVSWPPQPRPNPFIPKRLQRELNMPHATAERELIYCEYITQQFKQSAQQAIFSHAEKLDELELHPSPLIRDLSFTSIDKLELADWIPPQTRIFSAKKIEYILDEVAPNLEQTEKVHGGVDIIKQQALCPFKAFAKWRLHAREMESPLPGLRPQDRGTIVHGVLERIWNQLHDHSTLLATPDIELSQLITNCIDETMLAHPNARSEYKQYIALEKARLHKLIWDWLQVEKEREPFIVDFSEKTTQIKLDQLTFSIRIDRIDEIMPGKKLIIDYKTGKNNDINNWFGNRPEEPQLPLYALLHSANTIGITFAQVAAGDFCFKGVSSQALDLQGIKLVNEIKKTDALSWEQQITQWQVTLNQLSHDFYHGQAQVDPKDPVDTCEWCTLKPLCRIHEEISIRENS